MPELDLHPVPLYDPLHPYHWEYDNLPLQVLKRRDEVINGSVDNHGKILREANGTQGTLSNRLNQSINADGSLKASAIDEALHNVAEHADGSRNLTATELDDFEAIGYLLTNPVNFVRMLQAERDKLALVADEATNMTIQVETPSNIVLFEQGPISLVPSSGITWQVDAPNKIKANLGFPVESAHRHYYDLEPITTDYINYKVTSTNTPYIEGSLRVYINGMRINQDYEIYVPGNLTTDNWTLNKFTADHVGGTFTLSNAITSDDIIRIDFDVALT